MGAASRCPEGGKISPAFYSSGDIRVLFFPFLFFCEGFDPHGGQCAARPALIQTVGAETRGSSEDVGAAGTGATGDAIAAEVLFGPTGSTVILIIPHSLHNFHYNRIIFASGSEENPIS